MAYDANALDADGKPSIVLLNSFLDDGDSGSSDAVEISNLSGLFVRAHAKHRGAVSSPDLAVSIETSADGSTWDGASIDLDDFTESGEATGSLTATGPFVRCSFDASDDWTLAVSVTPAGVYS